MEYVEKPTKGFNSPYQVLVYSLANHMLAHPPQQYEEKWFDYWNCLDENECQIKKPVALSEGRWETTIASDKRGIPPTKIRFNPLNTDVYFKQALSFNQRKFGLGYHVSEPGFYFTSGSDTPILVVRRETILTEGIRYQGCEMPKGIYTISPKKDTINFDCPVVKGSLPIIYL